MRCYIHTQHGYVSEGALWQPFAPHPDAAKVFPSMKEARPVAMKLASAGVKRVRIRSVALVSASERVGVGTAGAKTGGD